MGRILQIASVLLVVLAVACVLITPDLTDDVDGVVHDGHIRLLATFAPLMGFLICALDILPRELPTLHHDLDRVAITCVRLC